MDGVIVVEVLGRKGAVVRRERFVADTISIGRAYDNDVILDDPSIDPHHARVSWNEEDKFAIEDFESANGTWVNGRRLSGSTSVELLGSIALGRTTIRLATGDTPVAPAAVAATRTLRDRDLRWPVVAGTTAVALLASCTSTYQATYDRMSATEGVFAGIGGLIMLALWAGGWALGTRLARGRAFFGHHVVITCLTIALFAPQATIQSAVETIWVAPAFGAWFSWILSGVVGFAMLYAHVDVASIRRRRVKTLIVAGLLAGVAGLGALGSVGSENSNAPLRQALGRIAPVPRSLIRSAGWDQFESSLESLEARLEPSISD